MGKFYSVTEDGVEIETVASLFGAAKMWEEAKDRRSVYEVVPAAIDGGAPWTRIGQISAATLLDVLESVGRISS